MSRNLRAILILVLVLALCLIAFETLSGEKDSTVVYPKDEVGGQELIF